VFPVRYELDLYILFRRNLVFKFTDDGQYGGTGEAEMIYEL
jgi:hypothetical protein